MKIFHVFGAMDVGGAELRTIDLFRHLGPQGFDFHFVTLTGREGSLKDEINALGGTIHPLPLRIDFPVRFVRLLRREKVDVLDSHVATFSGALVLLAWIARVPRRIAHFRSDGDGHPSTLRRRLQRRVMVRLIRHFATDVVGVSPSALTFGYREGWEREGTARVVANGVSPFVASPEATSLRSLIGARSSEPIIIHVGRPSPEKNRRLAVRVVHWLHEHDVPAHLALAGGTGPDTAAIRQDADVMGIAGFVHDLGTRSDAVELMSQADALILTSVREGLPGVVLESLSTGTPVVASDLPGVEFVGAKVRGVRLVGLDQPLSSWGAAVQDALEVSRLEGARDAIRRSFAESPFSMEVSVAAHRAVYEGER